jgi:NADH-quinone oxidoreductase subunit J
MFWIFAILAGITAGSALAAVMLPRLVHSALCLSVTFAGLAAIYLQLGAEFIGFAQILVYVGAVAILIVFAILLTRNSDIVPQTRIGATSWLIGVAIACMVFGVIAICVMTTPLGSAPATAHDAAVKSIGRVLMTKYVLALETMGLLLTAAMIGAVVIALPKRKNR